MVAPHRPLSAALPGTWELVSRIDDTDAGEPRVDPSLGAEPAAILFHDRSGHFAAQFISGTGRPAWSPTPR
jgi:hypothetical protein